MCEVRIEKLSRESMFCITIRQICLSVPHTVQSRVFSTSPLTPRRIVLSPLQSCSPVHRGSTADPPRSAAVPWRYIELPIYVNGTAIDFYLSTHRGPPRSHFPVSFSHSVQIFNPFHRIPLSAGVRGLVKKT